MRALSSEHPRPDPLDSVEHWVKRDILPGTEGYEMVAMINVGYPAPDSKPSAMHGVRKTIGELVMGVE